MTRDAPDSPVKNEFGICSVSLGDGKYHSLEKKLRAAADAGFTIIDLFDGCWAAYLVENGVDPSTMWDATEENLRLATQLGDMIRNFGMTMSCVQPLRCIEGVLDPVERRKTLDAVAQWFPFMRAMQTDMLFMCANVRGDDGVTSDLDIVAADLAELGDMAAAFAAKDGGPMIKVGYEALSWAQRNLWIQSWEVVEKANRPNVGMILDTFNMLAVEYADPYNPAGHGRKHDTEEQAIKAIKDSMSTLVKRVTPEKIFFVQIADAELVDPAKFHPPADPSIPRILPWSRGYRLYPMEQHRGGYMPVTAVLAAILATGYTGPLGLEVFNRTLLVDDSSVPDSHAKRGFSGLAKLVAEASRMEPYWT
ncbi:AP endonuclease [Limtongia smithiae]|uniref:AP endonuclease n=1 Tax=Limtongia smithiae TaxID=1125753 RepID=UPI0034CF63A2